MTVPATIILDSEVKEFEMPECLKLPEELRNVGRPTKMTETTVNILEHWFAEGCSDKEACLFAGIHKQTLYDYCKLNPEFTDRKESLKAYRTAKARQVTNKDLKDMNSQTRTSTAKWLEEKADGKAIQSVNMQVASYNVVRKQYNDPKD